LAVTLTPWLVAALDAAGCEPDPVASDDTVEVVLDLARDAAHAVARPAAPLGAFALGYAIGRAGGDVTKLRAIAAAIAGAATSFDQETEP
jgi:hypothetical protein